MRDNSRWGALAGIQLAIARRWLQRGQETKDRFAKFFFYFTGLNALYFLWKEVDELELEPSKPVNEGKQIENLIRKLDEGEASRVLEEARDSVEYFSRRRPIQRMDRRGDTAFEGDPREGRKWQRRLVEGSSSVDRLVALGQILYLVRSNLFHGSKLDAGDDHEVIEAAIGPLERLVSSAMSLTEAKLGRW